MEFHKKIISLRKENGYSQEELGNKIGVTRQTISNWELGISAPDLPKIVELAKLFNISTDELLGMEKVEKVKRSPNFEFEYKSKRMIKGIPLVHIHLGLMPKHAKGIIAIGNVATGGIAIGGVSIGLISIGALAIGLLAFGGFAIGFLLALAGISFGLVSLGGVAIGLFSIGGVAIGMYSIGGCAIAGKIGYGGYAVGKVALNTKNGKIEFLKTEIRSMIELSVPNTWKVIKNIFIGLGK